MKKWNSKLFIWVILDLWSIKVKKIDKIALKVNPKVLIFFLFLHENICCGYSLEVPRGIRKNVIWIPRLLIWSNE